MHPVNVLDFRCAFLNGSEKNLEIHSYVCTVCGTSSRLEPWDVRGNSMGRP